MNGSTEPEDRRDSQCKHCGLWFSNSGIYSHERNCDLAEFDETLVPLVDETPTVDQGSDPPGKDGPVSERSADGSGANPPPHSETVTDGGRNPPTFSADDEEPADDVTDDATVACPVCSDPAGMDRSDVDESERYVCETCGALVSGGDLL